MKFIEFIQPIVETLLLLKHPQDVTLYMSEESKNDLIKSLDDLGGYGLTHSTYLFMYGGFKFKIENK